MTGKKFSSGIVSKRLIALTVIMMCIIGIFCPVTAYDVQSGSITVKLTNLTEYDYYVALLAPEPSRAEGFVYDDTQSENNNNARRTAYEYTDDSGMSLFVSESGAAISGRNNRAEFTFTGSVPTEFKVMVVTFSGATFISPVLQNNHYNCYCVYDISAGTLTATNALRSDIAYYIKLALISLVIVLGIEILLMLIFKLDLKKNLKYVIGINIITWILMTVAIIFVDQTVESFGLGALFLLGAEAIVIFIETLYYSDRLIAKEGGIKGKRNVGYAIAANVLSFIVQIPVLAFFTFVDFLQNSPH